MRMRDLLVNGRDPIADRRLEIPILRTRDAQGTQSGAN